MPYFLGLDVAKDSFAAAVLDEAGQLVVAATFTNDSTGFSGLLADSRRPRKPSPSAYPPASITST